MEQTINLKKLERDTAAAIFKSGIVEIGIGQILLVSALAMYFDDIRYYIEQGLELGAYSFLQMYRGLYDARSRRVFREINGPHSRADGWTLPDDDPSAARGAARDPEEVP